MVNHTYINDKLEIQSESKYVFLSVQPGRWNLLYFQPVGDANNHGVFMTDHKKVAERVKAMADSSALGFFKMIKGEIVEKKVEVPKREETDSVREISPLVKPLVDYKKMKWMDLRNYAKEMKMSNYSRSKKVVILEWLDKNIG